MIPFQNMRGSNEGYGFVHYANTPQGIESAINAVSAMNNVSVGGVHYKVGLSISLEKKLNDLMNGHTSMYPSSQQMYYPPQAAAAAAAMYYPPAAAPYYGAAAPPSYYANNQPVYVPPPVYPHHQQQMLLQRQQQFYRSAAPAYTPADESTTSEEESSGDDESNTASPVVAPATAAAPVAKYEITLPAAKTLDEDFTYAKGSSSSSDVKTLPAAAHDLQKQLDDARGDCGANKHSTMDVYQDMQEHVACVDIIDY